MITLTMKDEQRIKIIQRVFRGEVTVVQAALVLGLSERQCYRVKARVKKVGAQGVVHGNRGRASQRKVKEKTVKRIIDLAQGKYQDFNDHHLTEKLGSEEKIELSREKVRRILRAHGILSPNKRRGIKHRSRRERRAAEGMMLQVDGSVHDWLEGRGPRLCLVGGIDDATGKVVGAFFQQAESSWGYFTLFASIFGRHGLPQSIYSDRHSVFWTDREPTLEEQLVNRRPTTEVPDRRRPRAESKDCGEPFKTAWSVSCGWPRPRLWSRPPSSWNATFLSITADSLNPPASRSPPGEKSARFRSNGLCVSNNSAQWRRTTRSAWKERFCRFPRHRPSVLTPTRESTCMCFSMARWSFSTKPKKSQPSTPKQRTHLAYIEPTANGKGSAMVRFLGWPLNLRYHPDIFSLLLT